MSKDKQKKHEVVEAPDASGKISRKQFEEELAKLQVELTRLQTWVKDKGGTRHSGFRGPGHGG
jgi:polyphosphate kinase 2 (PPK2 family)